jgi:hypothetical protein
MQRFLALFLLTGLCNCIKAQETDNVKNVMRAVTSSISFNYTVCTDNADFPDYLIKQVNIYLEKDTILHLSPQEKVKLQTKLSAARHVHKWQGNTVNGIPVIKTDAVEKATGDSAAVWKYFKKQYPKSLAYTLYSFSRPVFIRRHTVCLFYFDSVRYGGLDPWGAEEAPSRGELCIYIKNGDTWVKKIMVYSYIT